MLIKIPKIDNQKMIKKELRREKSKPESIPKKSDSESDNVGYLN